MMQAGGWNLERLSAQQHIVQAEWVSTDRVTFVGEGQLRAHSSNGWVPASFPAGSQCIAEHFSVGKVLELSQLRWSYPKVKCLVLNAEDQVFLRGFVSGSDVEAGE